MIAVAEKYSVEDRIDNIAKGSCKDQGNSDNENSMRLILQRVIQPVSYTGYGNNSKECKEKLSGSAPKFLAPGHSIVFKKMNPEPVQPKHTYLLTQNKVGLNVYFTRLVDKQHQKNDDKGLFHSDGLLSVLLILGLDAKRRMRNQFESFLLDQVPGYAAYAIGLVLDSQQGVLKVTDKLLLADGQLNVGFF